MAIRWPTQVFKYVALYVSRLWSRLNTIINSGIKNVEEPIVFFSTITTSIYGFSAQAITASIDPIGIVISTAVSARPPYGLKSCGN